MHLVDVESADRGVAFVKMHSIMGLRPPTKQAFVDHVLRHLRGLGWPDPIFDESIFAIRSAGALYGLENAFKGYRLARKGDREAFVTRWFAALAESDLPTGIEEVQSLLMPRLRRRDEALRFAAASDFNQFSVERPFSDDLVIGLGVDTETSIVHVYGRHLADWGVDEAAVWEMAMHNLRRRSADTWVQVAPGVFIAAWKDAYDSARVLLPDLVRRIPIEGEPVVMLPDRDTLLVSSRRDPLALATMAQLAVRMYDESGRPLSVQPLELRGDDVWVPVDLQGPMKNAIDERLSDALAQTYSWQEQLLMKTRCEDVFYASLLIHRQDDDVTSICVWTRDVATLLPKSDIIAFVRTDDDRAFVPWEAATAIIGPLREEPGMWPPRFRVQAFPNDEQFEALKACATM